MIDTAGQCAPVASCPHLLSSPMATPAKRARSGVSVEARFEAYKSTLDGLNETRERLVRNSRTLTQDSKKAIFALLKQWTAPPPLDSLLPETTATCLAELAALSEEDHWRFYRNLQGGVEEFLEAYLLAGYLHAGSEQGIASLDECSRAAFGVEGRLDAATYLGALSDLTGELRRCAVNAISDNRREETFRILDVLRQSIDGMASIKVPKRCQNKVTAMEKNLQAIEQVCYTMRVRGAEFKLGDERMEEDPGNDD